MVHKFSFPIGRNDSWIFENLKLRGHTLQQEFSKVKHTSNICYIYIEGKYIRIKLTTTAHPVEMTDHCLSLKTTHSWQLVPCLPVHSPQHGMCNA